MHLCADFERSIKQDGTFAAKSVERVMLWLAAGILFAVFNAGTMLVSQKYKIEGVLMSGLRGVGVAAIYSPAAFLCRSRNRLNSGR